MGVEKGYNRPETRDTVLSESQRQKEVLKQKILKDQKTIQALAYLTTLARLPESSDLDELFDGEVQLGEEELLSIYSLLEILNGSNTIEVLNPPQKMNMDIDWAQDYNYELTYNTLNINGKNVSQISSLFGSGKLPLTDAKIKFNYNPLNQVESLDFERHIISFNQKILLKRVKGLVSELTIARDYVIDNKLTITYNYLGKPEIIEQTKLGLLSDKTVFEYDEKGNLKSIIYVPTLSLKHLKGLKNAAKTGKNVGGVLKGVQMAGEYIAFTTLKKLKGADVIEVESQDGIIKSTKSNLDASNWFYKEGFSNNSYNSDGTLNQVYLEADIPGPDDKKTLTFEY